jgi:hypothetical protein
VATGTGRLGVFFLSGRRVNVAPEPFALAFSTRAVKKGSQDWTPPTLSHCLAQASVTGSRDASVRF